jgi:hypothetical protein
MHVQKIGEVTAIRDAVEVPALGALAINAWVVHADEPVLVDTGRPVEREAFLEALGSIIDPAELRWVWLTHPDRDHMGSLFDVLALAPQARLVTTFLAAGYLTVEFEVPLDRLQLVNPGESLSIGGGRRLHAFRPPVYDSPMTVGFFDDQTGVCVSSDCFGGLMPSLELAEADDISDLDPQAVRDGQLAWTVTDSPWVNSVDRSKFAATYAALRDYAPEVVLSTHLPPATGQFDRFLDLLEAVPDAPPMEPPVQAMLDAMLAELGAGPPGAPTEVAGTD